jgi:hypothetical protein
MAVNARERLCVSCSDQSSRGVATKNDCQTFSIQSDEQVVAFAGTWSSLKNIYAHRRGQYDHR